MSPRKIIETPADDALSTSPFEDDLAERLAAAAPRPRLPVATGLLAAGVLLVGGFTAGVQADRHWGPRPASPAAANLLGQFAARGGLGQRGGGLGGFGQNGASQAGANATTGTIRLVDGGTIYVQTSSGIVRVRTTHDTKVTVAHKATTKDLKTGASVVVHGTPGQDGTVTATSVDPGQ